MLVDAVTELSIWCNQCWLSMNNSNTWHDTYLTGNGHGKCRSMFLDKISCLLGKCNGPKLFYFLESQNNYFRKLQISILQIISIYPFRKFQIFISFRFVSQITVSRILGWSGCSERLNSVLLPVDSLDWRYSQTCRGKDYVEG